MQPQVTTLSNGITVITDHNPATPLLFASIGFRVGSLHDFIYPGSPHKRGDVERELMNGLSHFTEHVVSHGHPDHCQDGINSIQRGLGFSSNTTNFSTGENATHFHATGRRERVLQLMPIYAQMLTFAHPDDDAVEFERSRIVHEMEAEEHTNSRRAGQAFNRARFGPNSVMGQMQGGTPDTLSKISLDDITDHLRRFYTADNCVFVSSGAMSHDEACDWAQRHLSRLPRGVLNQPVLPKRTHGDVFAPNTNKTNYVDAEMYFPLPGLSMRHYGEAQLITHVVADHMQKLADRTGFYSIGAWLSWESENELYIKIGYNCSPNQAAGVARDIADALAQMHNFLSERELEDHRMTLLNIADNENMLDAMNPANRGHRLMYEFSRAEPLVPERFDVDDIRAVGNQDVMDTIHYMLTSRPDMLFYGGQTGAYPTGDDITRRINGQIACNDQHWNTPNGHGSHLAMG
jgi:predicted Zn-dependent peptidase